MINHPKFFKENGYVVHPKMLNGELLDFVGIHAYNMARITGPSKEDNQIPNTPAFYDDFVMMNLHDHLLPKMEKATGLELYPTYTYYRVYKEGDENIYEERVINNKELLYKFTLKSPKIKIL